MPSECNIPLWFLYGDLIHLRRSGEEESIESSIISASKCQIPTSGPRRPNGGVKRRCRIPSGLPVVCPETCWAVRKAFATSQTYEDLSVPVP